MIFFILSFFVGYILSFGLVRLKTIWLSARAGAHIQCRWSRSHAEDVTIIDVIIKTQDRKYDWGANDVMPGNDELRILVFFEKAVSWDLTLGEASWDLKLDEASPVCGLRDAPCVCWVRWNGQRSKSCVSLSSCQKTKLKKSINVSYLN